MVRHAHVRRVTFFRSGLPNGGYYFYSCVCDSDIYIYIYIYTNQSHHLFFLVLSCHVCSLLFFSFVSFHALSVGCFCKRTEANASQSASCPTLIYRRIPVNTILTHRLLGCRCLFHFFCFCCAVESAAVFHIYVLYIWCIVPIPSCTIPLGLD